MKQLGVVICITDSLANTKWRKCINPMGVNLGVVVVASTIGNAKGESNESCKGERVD